MNTHRNVVFATSVYERWIGPDRAPTRFSGLAPLFHVTGLIAHVTLAMLTGGPLVLFYRFDAEEACRLTERHRATFTVSAVTAFVALLGSDAMRRYDLDVADQGLHRRRADASRRARRVVCAHGLEGSTRCTA